MDTSKDVFISHSSADSKLAYAMCDYLEEKGIRCWIAPRDIPGGVKYGKSIIMGVKTCKIMVVLFNNNANDSDGVETELERAFHYKLTLIPFKLDETIPSDSLEFSFGSFQWLDATKGNPEDHFDLLYQNCVRVLGKKEGVIEEKPVPPIITETKENPAKEIPVQHQEGNNSQDDKENEIEKKKLGVFKAFLYTSIFISILTIPVIGLCVRTNKVSYLNIVLFSGFLLLAFQFIIFSIDFLKYILKRFSNKPTDSIHLIIYFFALFLGFLWLVLFLINIGPGGCNILFGPRNSGLTIALIIAAAINYWKIITLQRK
jgi:hypothetical protein